MQITQSQYSRFTQNMHGNVLGGITAAIIALPLALAFGIASGIGPLAGLYGAVVVGFFAAIFGGTPSQISGPTGPMTVVMSAITAQYLAQYPESGLVLAFTTVILAGLFQIAMGLFKLGKFIIMVPYPVISGFMTGIGTIIIVLQLAPLLGFDSSVKIITALQKLPEQINSAHVASTIIGLFSLAILFCWRGRLQKWIPAPIIVLLLASLVMLVVAPTGVEVIGNIPSALPSLYLPAFEISILSEMLINALMLALLGAIDSLLTSLVADNMTNDLHDSDKELIGQGIGNTLAGIVGGLPGAGATMRTVVNIKSGGDGPLSGATHSVVLFLAMMGLGIFIQDIPLAALAAILIKVGIDIIDWPFIRRAFRLPRFTLCLMLVVLILTLFVDLITAVFVGVFIKNIMVINRLSSLELGHVVIADGTETELPHKLDQHDFSKLARAQGEVALLRITGPLSYAVTRGLSKNLHKIRDPKVLIIEFQSSSIIGISTLLSIEQLVQKKLSEGVIVKLVGMNIDQRSEFNQLGLIETIGPKHCYSSFSEALTAA